MNRPPRPPMGGGHRPPPPPRGGGHRPPPPPRPHVGGHRPPPPPPHHTGGGYRNRYYGHRPPPPPYRGGGCASTIGTAFILIIIVAVVFYMKSTGRM